MVLKGWCFKMYSNFLKQKHITASIPFVNTPGTFLDHPTRQIEKHLNGIGLVQDSTLQMG